MLGLAFGLGSLAWGVWRWVVPQVPAGFVLLGEDDGAVLLDDDAVALMEVE